MAFALLAAFFFAGSAVSARRAVRHYGSNNANLGRICLGALCLGVYAHGWGAGLRGPALGWFIASGIVGFGVCDTAIYLALPRLGAGLTVLVTQCLAAPVAALTEWGCWGGSMQPGQILGGLLTLGGVAFALAPEKGRGWHAAERKGWWLALTAAAGQGLGAALSRHGQMVSSQAGFALDGLSVTYQRILTGVVFAAAWRAYAGPGRETSETRPGGAGWAWLALAALCGPTLGVACYQQALQSQPAGVVTSIVALTPLAVAPLAWLLEREAPSPRSLAGGVAAVAGVIVLARSRG